MLLRIGFLALSLFLIFPAYADDAPLTPSAPLATPALTIEQEAAEAAKKGIPQAPSETQVQEATTPDSYIEPSWPALVKTMVRFNALDLADNNLLDDYAKVTDCDIYQFYYKDDFKWNEVRKKIRTSVDMESSTFPAHYYYYTVLELDRYDFDKKLFRFTAGTTIKNVNIFKIFTTSAPPCGGVSIDYMPRTFEAVSDVALNMPGLPLSPADAQALLRQLDVDRNTRRLILIKLDMTVTYINRLNKVVGSVPGKKPEYHQAVKEGNGTAKLDVHIDAVNFYEDADMTKLIYSIKP